MNLNNALFFGGTSEIATEISKNLKKNFNIISLSRTRSGNMNYSKEIKISFDSEKFPKKKLQKIIKKKISLVIFFQAYQPTFNKKFYELDATVINKVINVNAISSIKMITFLIDRKLLKNSCKIIFFSSRSGSISERGLMSHHKPGGNNLYRASKSILNSLIKNISFEFKFTKNIFIAYHPGWVKTRSSGGSSKAFSKKFAAMKFLQNLQKLKLRHTGNFLDYNLKKIPW
jgi:short-subunit dehydrogenase